MRKEIKRRRVDGIKEHVLAIMEKNKSTVVTFYIALNPSDRKELEQFFIVEDSPLGVTFKRKGVL